MWTTLLAFALANPKPIATPCCGAKPVRHANTDRVSVAPPDVSPEARKAPSTEGKAAEGPVRNAVCDSVRHCGTIQCDHPSDDTTHHRSDTSDRAPAGKDHTLRAEVVGMGTFVCWVDRWVAIVEGPSGSSWVHLADGGGGTKGGTTAHLKQVLPLDNGLFWIEIQRDLQHTMETREVVLEGFVVGLRDHRDHTAHRDRGAAAAGVAGHLDPRPSHPDHALNPTPGSSGGLAATLRRPGSESRHSP